MNLEYCDVLVVGAGPGGLAAAKGAKEAGAKRVVVLERDNRPGGILNQCIHDGFGIIRYHEQLTGPEYAVRASHELEVAGAELLLGHQVVRMTEKHDVIALSSEGLKHFIAGAVVLATGCRERTRGAISIPGSRPAGVYTAGVVQNLVNVKNIMPGSDIVILGSGDVGMIMARRLTLEGANVRAVVEVLPEPAGLSRNVSQCLYDFGIPIRCSHTVSKIIGKKRLISVEISRVDESFNPIKGTEETLECDTLVLSVGLIPENEVAQTAGIAINGKDNGVMTDAYLQTSVSGVFSCGNSRSIMDLADYVSEQGELAGRNAVALLKGKGLSAWDSSGYGSMTKGFPVQGEVTCTLCPNGCQVKWDGSAFSGNKCKRGEAFAMQERRAPKRVFTSTVKATGASEKLLPVRTKEPIFLSDFDAVMKEIKDLHVSSFVKCGDGLKKIGGLESGEVSIVAAGELTCDDSARQYA